MQPTNKKMIKSLLVLATILLVGVGSRPEVEAKKQHSKSSSSSSKCQDKECELSGQHFALYSNVRRALNSEFNLNGKEIVPMLRSVEVLRKRFDVVAAGDQIRRLNGSELVLELLNNNTLKEAMKVFNSDEGRELVTFYRASVNGRGQNLACSQMRIDDLKRVTARVESSWEFHTVFAKINKNYLKKSAKKCLKHSCTSVELAMTKLGSILPGSGKQQQQQRNKQQPLEESNSILTDNLDQQEPINAAHEKQPAREFEAEELELCKFFKRTNATDCKISGTELGNLSFLAGAVAATTDSANDSNLEDHLKQYAANNMQQQQSLEEAGKQILAQCTTMLPLLEYNLSPIKWYRERGLIDDQKLASRAFWCKGLSYWLQMDRLCGELSPLLAVLQQSNRFSSSSSSSSSSSNRQQVTTSSSMLDAAAAAADTTTTTKTINTSS